MRENHPICVRLKSGGNHGSWNKISMDRKLARESHWRKYIREIFRVSRSVLIQHCYMPVYCILWPAMPMLWPCVLPRVCSGCVLCVVDHGLNNPKNTWGFHFVSSTWSSDHVILFYSIRSYTLLTVGLDSHMHIVDWTVQCWSPSILPVKLVGLHVHGTCWIKWVDAGAYIFNKCRPMGLGLYLYAIVKFRSRSMYYTVSTQLGRRPNWAAYTN